MNMKPEGAIEIYLTKVASGLATGHAREHAHRPAFQDLIQSFEKELSIVNDPKRSEHGAPDFIFLRKELTIGYAETKDVGVSLDKTEKSDQMTRYFGYSNLILSDYLEFRFFRNGERYADPIVIAEYKDGRFIAKPENFSLLSDTISDFLKASPEKIKSGVRLAKIMGGKARRIRENVARFVDDESEKGSELRAIYAIIKKLLVHDLTPEQFADMYAQTLVYGLFVARYHDETPENFTRQEARELVPPSNPFLQHFFDHIAGVDFDKRLAYIVNELCGVFSVADVKKLMGDYFHADKKDSDAPDPIIHFYEDFLKEYDPAQRLKLGAFYTPLPVVRFIVRAIDDILVRDFGLAEGLADTSKIERDIIVQGRKGKEQLHKVQFLDPAVGTGTFLNEVIKKISQKFEGQEGRWKSYVDADLLPRLYGFELMMAPYTIAHLKLAMTLRESGYEKFSKRLGIYLTNSLEEAHEEDNSLFGPGVTGSIAQEALDASDIKNKKPIMVVLGNPPYSVSSSNKSDWIINLIADYKKDLKERKINLDDDYIKFIRFAEHFIEKNGSGIVAMITNNSYIDGITHRQMRKHLLETFDDIYILDLHGNSLKKEISPFGGKDENVFDIMQGVSISIFIRNGKEKKKLGNVHHSEFWGPRDKKYIALEKGTIENIDWKKINYQLPYYFFVPKDFEEKSEYDKGFFLPELFKNNNTGVKTDRNELFIDLDREKLANKIKILLSGDFDNNFKETYRVKNSGSYKIIQKIKGRKFNESHIAVIQYRPFDYQWIYYDPEIISRPGFETNSHLLKNNYALITLRVNGEKNEFVALATKVMVEKGSLPRGNYMTFPLYLYTLNGEKVPNLQKEIVSKIKEKIKGEIVPEDVFDYIYSVLHSSAYREKYKEFLKIDFPRVPYPKDESSFWKLVDMGRELRKLHLMESPILSKFITTFPVGGENEVEKISYTDERVFINKTQYFGGVSGAAWNFYIGGYQPAQKWLKDRKGRKLTNDDLVHYQKMIVALTETDRIMKEIDTIITV